MEANAVRFADAARRLGDAARAAGLVVPAFRSPPRPNGVLRSLRRRPDGSVAVSVALRGRPWAGVVADMIDGVVATNQLSPSDAGPCRDRLWQAMSADLLATRPVGEAA